MSGDICGCHDLGWGTPGLEMGSEHDLAPVWAASRLRKLQVCVSSAKGWGGGAKPRNQESWGAGPGWADAPPGKSVAHCALSVLQSVEWASCRKVKADFRLSKNVLFGNKKSKSCLALQGIALSGKGQSPELHVQNISEMPKSWRWKRDSWLQGAVAWGGVWVERQTPGSLRGGKCCVSRPWWIPVSAQGINLPRTNHKEVKLNKSASGGWSSRCRHHGCDAVHALTQRPPVGRRGAGRSDLLSAIWCSSV